MLIDGADVARRRRRRRCAREIAFVADDSFLFSATRRREHRLRAARRDAARRSKRRRGAPRPHGFIRELPDGYDTRDRRARPDALRRPAPAGRDRPGAARRPADPDPRRRHLLGRRDAPRRRSRPACARRWRAGRRSSSPTASRPISLADEIVVMDGGRIVDRGTHEELLERCPLLRGDRRARARRTRSSCSATSRSARRWRSCERHARATSEPRASRGGDPFTRARTSSPLFRSLWRLIRGEDQRWRKVRWMIGLLRPYRRQVLLMFVALLLATGAGAGAAVPGRQGDRRRHPDRRHHRARPDRRRLPRRRAARLGPPTCRPTWSAGSATRALQDLRERIFTHLQAMSIGFFTRNQPGGADLADDQRRRGARPAGQPTAW